MNNDKLIKKFKSNFPTKEQVIINSVDTKGWDFTKYFEDELEKLINTAKEEGKFENQTEIGQALKALSKIVDINHGTDDIKLTATHMIGALHEENRSRYVEKLHNRIDELERRH